VLQLVNRGLNILGRMKVQVLSFQHGSLTAISWPSNKTLQTAGKRPHTMKDRFKGLVHQNSPTQKQQEEQS